MTLIRLSTPRGYKHKTELEETGVVTLQISHDPWMLPPSVERVAGIVHHYTSRAGFLGLIEGSALWSSESQSLNDLSEIRHGWALIEEWLNAQPASDIMKQLREAADPKERPREVFVLSASLDADDVNQWRAYAEDGHGYNVGIDTSAALAVRKATDDDPESNFSFASFVGDSASVSPWLRVTYDDAIVADHLAAIALSFEAAVQSIEATDYKGNDDAASDDYWELREATFAAVATVAALSKPSGFRGEAEARIITTLPYGQKHYRFRTGSAGVFPYVPLVRRPEDTYRSVVDLSDDPEPLPLKSVLLGPRLRSENIDAVRLLLRAGDYNTDSVVVDKSKVPLA